MIVVADTSPLNYLILIGQIHVLEALYGKIAMPTAVASEMLSADAPRPVREWAASPPDWITVHPNAAATIALSQKLDAGEREAIRLALFLNSPVLIIDEAIGRKEAQRVGLRIIGTLGVLREAHSAGLLDLKSSIQRLQATSSHIATKIATRTLAELLRQV